MAGQSHKARSFRRFTRIVVIGYNTPLFRPPAPCLGFAFGKIIPKRAGLGFQTLLLSRFVIPFHIHEDNRIRADKKV